MPQATAAAVTNARQSNMKNPMESLEKFLTISNYSSLIFSVLVLASTFAVLYFNTSLGKLKDQQLAAYQKDADERIQVSKAVAEEAKKQAAIANRDQEALAVRLEQERLKVLQLTEEGKRTSLAVLQATAKAQDAELKLAEYTKRRLFTPSLGANMSLSARAFAGTMFSVYTNQDVDSTELALTIEDLLSQSGWKHVIPKTNSLLAKKLGMNVYKGIGIFIPVRHEISLLPAAKSILGFLKEISPDVGIRVVREVSEFDCSDCIVIRVGSKN
jgi:hypothetical protein